MKTPLDPYPLLYEAHHSRHMEDLPFWMDLAGETGGPILELGCGTGRLLLPLTEAGYNLFGIDRDYGMLQLLRKKMKPELASRVNCWQGDFTCLGIAQQFPLVILPCNTLSTLTSAMREALYEQVRRMVVPGGIFAASVPNPAFLRRLPAISEPEIEEIFPHPTDGEPVQVSSAWQRDQDSLVFEWQYDHLFPDGRVERTSAQARHYFVEPETFQAELGKAGLRLVETFGDFNRSPFRRSAPYYIFLASSEFK